MRLGDLDALYAEFEKAAWYNNADRDEVAETLLLAAPTIDAVEVVRCKNCLYWQSGENECEKWEYCAFHNIGIGPHSFCSYGERKEADGNG